MTDAFNVGFERLEWHIEGAPTRLTYDHAEGGKLPRNHEWRPYRFCIQDVIFGTTVIRHVRELNRLRVDVFLTAEIAQYQPDCGVRWLASFLLCEAFKCGGSMEIEFTEFVEDGMIPSALCDLAAILEVPFESTSIEKGLISSSEATSLFGALVGYPEELRERLAELAAQQRLTIERVCYSILRGVWTLEEVESIVLGSEFGQLILSGEIQPEQRHLYSYVQFGARTALLAGFMDKKMKLREHMTEAGVALDLEDDERAIIAEVEGDIFAKWYSCPDEQLHVPWLQGGKQFIAEPNENIVVAARARDSIGLLRLLSSDIDLIGKRASQSFGEKYFILVPFDFNLHPMTDELRGQLIKRASALNVGICICPESVASLDAEVQKRFRSSRIMRE